jgi:nucleotide-binding universal stress UspA family protein
MIGLMKLYKKRNGKKEMPQSYRNLKVVVIPTRWGEIEMKIMVCVDGSKHSQKTLEKAFEIAGGCSVDEVSLINVFEKKYAPPKDSTGKVYLTHEDLKIFEKIDEKEKEEKEKILRDSAKQFENSNIKITTILETGHPAETIVRVASEGNYDIIVIGNRGLGGLKKFLLGSVCNAVLQEAKCSVLVVK